MEGLEHSIHLTPEIGGLPLSTLVSWGIDDKQYSMIMSENQAVKHLKTRSGCCIMVYYQQYYAVW